MNRVVTPGDLPGVATHVLHQILMNAPLALARCIALVNAGLDLTLQMRESAIVIPEPAVMSNGDNFSVFVVDEKGNAQVRPVEVGLRLPGRLEVLKGLNPGDKVVVEGTQKLRPGAPVKLAPPAAAAPYLDSEGDKTHVTTNA